MLQEQSQVEIGRAFSGAAAAADDPSAIFYNPAAMTELPHMQISTGATALFIQSRQRDLGTTRTGPGATPTQAVGGGNGGNPFAPVVPLPTSFASKQLSDRVWLGAGLSAPFGLKLRYDPDFFGRYDSTYSNLLTLNGQLSLAYKVTTGFRSAAVSMCNMPMANLRAPCRR
jgi:long-chain fatty acid transport protein